MAVPKRRTSKRKKARAQYAQDRAGDRHPEVSPLPEHEAPASCLRGVRILRCEQRVEPKEA